ncbi:hypothetical protein J5991_04090 [Methanocorpusculum sp.]|nr:hypothetical protein [Methanocorpusculum sp.]
MVTEKQKRHILKRKICGFIDLSASERLPQIVNSYFVKLGSKRKSVRGKVVVTMPPESPATVVRIDPLNKKYREQRLTNVSVSGKTDTFENVGVPDKLLGSRDPVSCFLGLYIGGVINKIDTATESNRDKKSKSSEDE